MLRQNWPPFLHCGRICISFSSRIDAWIFNIVCLLFCVKYFLVISAVDCIKLGHFDVLVGVYPIDINRLVCGEKDVWGAKKCFAGSPEKLSLKKEEKTGEKIWNQPMSSKGHKRRLWIRYWDKIGVWTGSVVRVLHRLGRLLLKERVWQICKHSVEVLRTIEMCCSKDLVVKNVGKLFTSVCSEKDFWRSEDQGRNWLSWVELINLWLLEKWKKSYWRAVALQSPRLSLFEGKFEVSLWVPGRHKSRIVFR